MGSIYFNHPSQGEGKHMLLSFFWYDVFSDEYFNVFIQEQPNSLGSIIHSHHVYLYEYFRVCQISLHVSRNINGKTMKMTI